MAAFTEWLKRTYLKLLLGINFFCAGLLLLVYLAPFIPPTWFYILAVLALGYPFLVLVNLLFVVWWLYKRHRGVYISLGTLALGFMYLFNLIGLNFGNQYIPDTATTVVSYNVRYFNAPLITDVRKQQQELQAILEDIAFTKPMILCGQEFSAKTDTETKQVFAYLQNNLKLKHIHRGGGSSLAICSKYPILKTATLSFEGSYNGAIYADLQLPNKIIRVYNVHLQSTGLGNDADEVLKKKNITTLNKKDTQVKYQRIGNKLKNAFIKRTEQARAIALNIKSCPHEVLICGDMNDTPMSYAYHTLVQGMKDSFHEKGKGLGSTYAGSLPALRIDYVLTSPTIEIYSHEVLPKTQSDHYAVKAQLGL